MDTFNQLKNLLPSENGKFVMVENGEPRFVVVPWREFEAMRGIAHPRVRFAEVADEVLDVPAYAPAYALAHRSFAKLAVDTGKIRLEDLPI